jgi:hypothetical protein
MDSTPTPSAPSYEELQQQLALLQQQFALLLQQQQKQQQQTATPASLPSPLPGTPPPPHSLQLAPAPALSSSSLKVAAPDIYDGTITKADTFISQLSLYFHGKRVQDPTDRIVIALSYMKGGTAGPWAKQKVKLLESVSPGQVSWEDFLKEFKKAFGDPNPGQTARHKISQLKQGTHTADEYVASFRELKDETGYNDVALVERFKKGLDQNLVDRIYHLPEMPIDLEEWISWAVKLDRQAREREVEKKSHNFFSRPPQKAQPQAQSRPFIPNQKFPSSNHPSTFPISQPSTSAPARQPDVVPMEIDVGWRSVKPLICFKCRRKGHKAHECTYEANINLMDYDSIKAHFREKFEKEAKEEKKDF